VSGGERERGSGEGDRERGALERDIYRETTKGESGGLRERGGERERREER
jgi:hypothetical protein